MDEPPDEMFCSVCGEPIRSSAKFCRHCGEPNRYRHGSRWGPTEEEGRPDADGGAPTRRPRRGDGYADADRRPGGDDGYADADRRPEQDRAYAETGRGRQPRPGGPAPDQSDSVPWRAYLPPKTRRVDQPAWRVVLGGIGLGLLGFLLLAIISGIAAALGFVAGLSLPVVLLGGTAIGQYIGFVGMSLWYLRYRGLDRERIKGYLGIRKPTLKEIGLIFASWVVILIGAFIVSVLAQLLTELLGGGEPGQADQQITEVLADNPEFVPVAILVMFLVVGPSEEILFRGIVQGRLREKLSAAPAIGITSVFFAVLHIGGIGGSLQGTIIAISVLTIAGAVLGSLYEYTQNLVVVALLHGFHNSMIVVFVYISAVYDLEEGTALLAPILGALPL